MLRAVRGGQVQVQRLRPTRAFDEHPAVAHAVANLARRAQQGGASSVLFLPERKVSFEAFAFAYHTGLGKEMNITRAVDQVLRGTIVINISGHVAGQVGDRVLGWAERELAGQGVRIGDDAKRFRALCAACHQAHQQLQAGSPRAASVDVTSITFEGKTVALSRAQLDRLQKASADSVDEDLYQLAQLGNQARRKRFGSENTYNLRVRTADGKTTEVRAIARNQPDKIEYATRIPIELPLLEGTAVIEAWPTGSAEVAGYVEARRYTVHFQRDLFDAGKAEATADQYQAAYPQVRWGTRHENDDLDLHHVNPSPRPYPDF